MQGAEPIIFTFANYIVVHILIVISRRLDGLNDRRMLVEILGRNRVETVDIEHNVIGMAGHEIVHVYVRNNICVQTVQILHA